MATAWPGTAGPQPTSAVVCEAPGLSTARPWPRASVSKDVIVAPAPQLPPVMNRVASARP